MGSRIRCPAPRSVKHPLGPAGTMVNERAVTVPEALLVPAAATHSPVLRAEIETMSDRVSRTVVGTMTVTMVPLASFTDTDVPLTPPGVTWPLALPRLAACGGGVKLHLDRIHLSRRIEVEVGLGSAREVSGHRDRLRDRAERRRRRAVLSRGRPLARPHECAGPDERCDDRVCDEKTSCDEATHAPTLRVASSLTLFAKSCCNLPFGWMTLETKKRRPRVAAAAREGDLNHAGSSPSVTETVRCEPS